MKSLNNVELIGHLGSDPECKEHDGKMVAKFSLATGEEWLDKLSKEKQTATEWHKVVCFNKLAEIVKKHLKKGERIYISGKLKTSRWQDKNNEARSITEIIADELILLSNKASDSN
jgi:single-strand DNA-binding protein